MSLESILIPRSVARCPEKWKAVSVFSTPVSIDVGGMTIEEEQEVVLLMPKSPGSGCMFMGFDMMLVKLENGQVPENGIDMMRLSSYGESGFGIRGTAWELMFINETDPLWKSDSQTGYFPRLRELKDALSTHRDILDNKTLGQKSWEDAAVDISLTLLWFFILKEDE
jgi:hypothetical protein